MHTLSTVGGGFVAGLFETAQRLGVERSALLRAAGLAQDTPQEGQARWPVGDVVALFEAAQRLTGRRDIGLEFAAQVRPGTFQVLGYALMTCRTLGEALALVPHYRRLVFDIGYSEMRMSEQGAHAVLEWHVLQPQLSYSPVLAEALIASWFAFGRWMAGVPLPLRQVTFQHAAAGAGEAFSQFFGCPVAFGQHTNALVFERSLLAMPLVQADETLHLAMREQARAAMEKAFGSTDVAQQVRAALIPLMPKCEATLAHVARALGVPARSLQRRLAEANTSFGQILDAVRKDLAKVYLRDASLSMLDVALLLGYAEQSSFTRAFRQWLGQSPLQWRREKVLQSLRK
ncbi:AraC family transcriptional regulator [Curvibacter sp. APW13]|uniref:AraC family transcriptional regulator n=1 Tax=Curvibacter sp. APW13 TaxID=3077236 RepID=UPI0028DE01B8|nr:AraC family transcriptional regulator [Curvibacter sp. APW13]MDT8989446.1 AraC family transcriptional regulator [Curvibacter sp. APW13]